MNKIYGDLAERIRGEIPEMDRLVQRVLSSWRSVKGMPDVQEVYLDSIALNLHGFYSGLERFFALISRHLDQNQPNGEMWHRDLLWQMTQDIEDIRPAVISKPIASELDGFRRFRHLVRNIYAFNLVPDKIEPLVEVLPSLWKQMKEELTAFADFLSDLAEAT